MSLESRYGWQDLYLSVGAWPERISQTVSAGNRERDELDFYLLFFVQAYHLRDWLAEQKIISDSALSAALSSYDCMLLCRDIANRYKHLRLNKKPSFDGDWSIWIDEDRTDRAWSITAKGKTWLLWDLMTECISFWEAAVVAFDIDHKVETFRPA